MKQSFLRMAGILLACVLFLTACSFGEKQPLSEEQIRQDVEEYLTVFVDDSAAVTEFFHTSKAEGDQTAVDCTARYTGDLGSGTGSFTLTYAYADKQWTLADIRVEFSEEAAIEQPPVEKTPANVVAEGKCGEQSNWTLTEDGVLTISGTGSMGDWQAGKCRTVNGGAFRNLNDGKYRIQTVIVEDGITDISESAFANCVDMTEIFLPDSLVAIGEAAFASCGLERITIPRGITDIPTDTFEWCFGLKEVILPDTVKTIGETAFYLCDNLEKLSLPDTVEIIEESAFYSCKSLLEMPTPKNLKVIGTLAFGNCDQLLTADIPEGVVELGDNVFFDCDRLEQISIPASVEIIGTSIAADCNALKEIVVSEKNPFYESDQAALYSKQDRVLLQFAAGWFEPGTERSQRTYTVQDGTKIIGERSFYYCKGIGKVVLPDSLNTIEEDAFRCSSLAEINIPENTKWIEGNVFADCNQLEKIEVDLNNPCFYFVDGALYEEKGTNADKTLVMVSKDCTSIRIEEGTTTLGIGAMDGCYKMENIHIPISVGRMEERSLATKEGSVITYDGTWEEWTRIAISPLLDTDLLYATIYTK